MTSLNEWTFHWRDSEIAKIERIEADSLQIVFSAAAVVRSKQADGFLRGVKVTCRNIAPLTTELSSDWVGGIRHGQILTDAGNLRTLPLPSQLNGPLTIQLTLINGTEIDWVAQALSAELPDHPHWTEALAC